MPIPPGHKAAPPHQPIVPQRSVLAISDTDIVNDGWGDEAYIELEIAAVDELPREVVVPDWDYNPQDDIIPTRTRWVNPRAGMRTISSF